MRWMVMAALAAGVVSTAAHAAEMRLEVSEAKRVQLSRDWAAIIVEDPLIADVTTHDRRLLILTGKSYGDTRLTALDAANRPIFSARVVVTQSDRHRVTFYRGAARQSLHCVDQCQPAPALGDDPDYFSAMSGARSEAIDASKPDGE